MKIRRELLLGIFAALAFGTAEAAPKKKRKRKRSTSKSSKRRAGFSGGGTSFRSCAAARAAGYSRMRPGDAGYSSNLDRDGDGIACE